MEHTVKILRIERKKVYRECIRFLKRRGSNNIYLYEGIKQHHPRICNFCFTYRGEISGVLHSKNSSHIHLFLSGQAPDRVAEKAAPFMRESFPGLKVIFCDEATLVHYTKGSRLHPKRVRKFIAMEVERSRFHPVGLYRGITPPADHASVLLPLQIQYEIEELGITSSEINQHKVLTVLTRRIGRDEITVIYDGTVPVAVASVNARFENICQIGSVYVVPEYRGKGYGSSLISSHVERLLNRYDRIVLFVDQNNSVAHRIYEKVGFTPSGFLVQAYYT